MSLVFIRKDQQYGFIRRRFTPIFSIIKWIFILRNKNIVRQVKCIRGLISTELGSTGIATSNLFLYENLYIDEMPNVNASGLKSAINGFTHCIAKKKEFNCLENTKIHIAQFFLNGILQYIEFLYKNINGSEKLLYCGSFSDIELLILKDIAEKKGVKVNLIKNNFNLIILAIESLFSFTKKRITKSNDSIKHFSSNTSTPSIKDKTIVLGFLEARRMSRLKAIAKGLEGAGYKVLYFCSNQKVHDISIARKDLEFSKKMVLDSDVLTKKMVIGEMKNASREVKIILKNLMHNSERAECQYRSVNLFKYCFKKLDQVIRYRYLQSRLSLKAIEALTNKVNIVAYVGIDTSVSTSTCINYFKSKGIPTFFYLYNPIESKAFYMGSLAFLNPSCWLVAGDIQAKNLNEAIGNQLDSNALKIVGDVDGYHLNNRSIEASSRDEQYISSEYQQNKTLLVISSYIDKEFTWEIKRTFFQSTYMSVRNLNLSLLIKPHPNEDVDLLRFQLSKWGVKARVLEPMNVESALALADLMVMQFSESAFTAFKMAKPVISICRPDQVFSFDKHWSFYSSGAVRHVALGNSFNNLILELINPGKARKLLVNNASEYLDRIIKYYGDDSIRRFCDEVSRKLAN